MDNFSSTFFSFSFKSNSTIENVLIELYFYEELFNLSNGSTWYFSDLYYDEPYYFVFPVINSKIKVELNSTLDEDLENLNLTLIEYQKINSDYYIYEERNQNYTIDYIYKKNIKTISLNYVIKNKNTNYFCLKFLSMKNDIGDIKIKFIENRYYYTLYEKNSLDIFDLKPNQTYHISLEAKKNNLFFIYYDIKMLDINYNNLPLELIIIYEDISEFTLDHLSQVIHYITSLTESFYYLVSESNTTYLSLNIAPKFQIEKFSIKYNIIKDIKTVFNLENNTSFSIPELYPLFTYEFIINSKILEKLEYEIIIKNDKMSSLPFNNISLIENPSNTSKENNLSFKKDGNYLKAVSSFVNTQCDTNYTTFLIKSYSHVNFFSIKVKIIGDNFYYLAEKVKKNIKFILAQKDYYFAINFNKNIPSQIIYVGLIYKSNEIYSGIYTMDYYLVNKKEFNINYPKIIYTHANDYGDEYNSIFEFEFKISDFYNHDILLLKLYSGSNLYDFNIDYKYVHKTSNNTPQKKDDTLIYIVIAIGSCLTIFTGIASTRVCCKKKQIQI